MDIHGSPWKSMDFLRCSWIFVEIRGNPWKSVEIRGKFQEALKLAENRGKQLFTFFAFLPPYIGVSGSPMYLKR